METNWTMQKGHKYGNVIWNLECAHSSASWRKKWIAGIEEDLQIMGVRRWRKQCEEGAEWKKITEKAKTHSGL
jgi:hypothetical protein